jgi:ankyrin repeat protein
VPKPQALPLFCLALVLAAAQANAGSPLPPAESKLVSAVITNNAAGVRAALAAGVNVNANVGEGRTPLIIAAMASRPEIVKLLLEKGADPAIKSEHPKIGNAVTAAFWGQNGEALNRPVAQVDPQKRATALEVLKLVTARKQGLNATVHRDGKDVTALQIATRYGATDAAKILTEAGAT